MKHRILTFAVVLISFAAGPSMAQVQQDAQAVSVLSSAYQAMGGSNVSSIQDTHTTVLVTETDGSGNSLPPESVTIETSGQNVNMQNPNSGVVVIVNAAQTQMSIASSSGTNVMSSLSLGNAGITHLPVFSVLAQWSNPQVILQYVGLEQIGSENVHHIRMQQPFSQNIGLGNYDQPLDLYIDTQSFFLVKMLYVQRAPSDLTIAVQVEADYSNYQQMSGIMVPMGVTYVTNGSGTIFQAVSSFAINQGTQPNDFVVSQ